MRIRLEGDYCRIIETTAGVPVARVIRTGAWRWTMRLPSGYSTDVTAAINDPAVLLSLVATLTKTEAKREAERAFK